jgi:hypothetical protein
MAVADNEEPYGVDGKKGRCGEKIKVNERVVWCRRYACMYEGG